jgi:hypothetical protein
MVVGVIAENVGISVRRLGELAAEQAVKKKPRKREIRLRGFTIDPAMLLGASPPNVS